jgi:nucleotidyltransferase substrate binding protein (TIGR01987 family)
MAQREELAKAEFVNFKRALKKLEEICKKEEDEIIRDATIQRFEFTFETAWKCLKRIAYLEGLDCFSPKSCFEVGFKMGFIEDEDIFLEIIDCRNQTTHIYNEDMAIEIYKKIRGRFLDAFKLLEEKIKERFNI